MNVAFEIRIGDLKSDDVVNLLQEHLDEMRAVSPPESTHALETTELQDASVTFWTAYDGDQIAGCAALKELDAEHGEIKSMRTSMSYRGHGIGKLLLLHLMAEARSRGYRRLSLETGSMDFFIPARTLYKRFGFQFCQPFAHYIDDPNSVFMTCEL